MSKHGAKLIFLVRLAFVVPYNLVNYVAPTSSIGFCQYMVGNSAVLLRSLPYIYISVTAADLTNSYRKGVSTAMESN